MLLKPLGSKWRRRCEKAQGGGDGWRGRSPPPCCFGLPKSAVGGGLSSRLAVAGSSCGEPPLGGVARRALHGGARYRIGCSMIRLVTAPPGVLILGFLVLIFGLNALSFGR